MLVVKVELHSAITGDVSEVGRLIIANDGKSFDPAVGHYNVRLGRKGANNARILLNPQRAGRVEGHARESSSVWSLVAKALTAIGFAARLKGPTRWAHNCHACGTTVHIGVEPEEAGDG